MKDARAIPSRAARLFSRDDASRLKSKLMRMICSRSAHDSGDASFISGRLFEIWGVFRVDRGGQFSMQTAQGLAVSPADILVFPGDNGSNPGLGTADALADIDLRQAVGADF